MVYKVLSPRGKQSIPNCMVQCRLLGMQWKDLCIKNMKWTGKQRSDSLVCFQWRGWNCTSEFQSYYYHMPLQWHNSMFINDLKNLWGCIACCMNTCKVSQEAPSPFLFSSPEGFALCRHILNKHLPYDPHDFQIGGICKVINHINLLAILATGSGKTGFLSTLVIKCCSMIWTANEVRQA